MITELLMRLMSLVLSKQGFAFVLGGMAFSFLMHNNGDYAMFIQVINDYIVMMVRNILNSGGA